MKKIILYFFVCFSLTSLAQDWAPFKRTDSLIQLKSNNQISFYYKSLYPIQSIVLDTTYRSNQSDVFIFKKGFSVYELYASNSNQTKKRISKIFGDTLTMAGDTSIYTTTDSLGFQLTFLSNLKVGTIWDFGISKSYVLEATVDSIKSAVILNNIVDSVATISIKVFDNNKLTHLTNHPFNVGLILSKSNGVLQTIDYTELSSHNTYSRLMWSGNKTTPVEKNNFEVGDEYSILTTVESCCKPGSWSETKEHWVIIGDTTIGTQRKTTILRQEERNYILTNITVDTLTPVLTDTIFRFFSTTDVLFHNYSGIIEDSVPGNSSTFNILHFPQIAIGQTNFRDSIFLMSHSDISYTNNGLISKASHPTLNERRLINLPSISEYNYSRSSNQVSYDQRKQILYSKINGVESGKKVKFNFDCAINYVPITENNRELVTYYTANSPTYQWYYISFGRSISIHGATNSTYRPVSSGNYFVQVIDSIGCVGVSDPKFYVYFSCSLGDSLATRTDSSLLATIDGADSYSWVHCSDFSTAANNSNKEFVPYAPGGYRVIIVKNGCIDTSRCINMVGLKKDYLENNLVKIYPNPASNELQISTDQTIMSVIVSDINGKTVEVKRFNNNIDVSTLSSGSYFMQVETESGIFTEKFVKR